MIITKAPYRISFFGGGSDIKEYFSRKQGKVLGCAIDYFSYISLLPLLKFFDYSIKVAYSKIETVRSPAEIFHPSVREILRRYDINHVEIHNWADLPARTGLGSSSSFAVALLQAIHAYRNEDKTPYDLAIEGIDIERNILNEYGGWQDQFHAAFGGLNLIEFSSDGVHVHPVEISTDMLQEMESRMRIYYTGTVRNSSDIQKGVVASTGMQLNDRHLDHLVECADEGYALLTDKRGRAEESISDFGKLLHESWLSKKALSKDISGSTIDIMYDRAMRAGAQGGKLLGAGGGGFTLFVTPNPSVAKKLDEAFGDLVQIQFKICPHGSRVIVKN